MIYAISIEHSEEGYITYFGGFEKSAYQVGPSRTNLRMDPTGMEDKGFRTHFELMDTYQVPTFSNRSDAYLAAIQVEAHGFDTRIVEIDRDCPAMC